MRISLCTFFLALFIVSTALTYTLHSDIEYYPTGTAPQLDKNMLDIYVPAGATETTPVVFFVHGGTWMYNDRSDFGLVGQVMADEEGFVTVIISYRLSDSLHPENTHPCHIEDVAQAFAWTVENISTYSGDPSKIIIMGHSSGAHLIGLLATNTYYIEAAGAEVSDIKGAVSFNMGVYDIPKLYADIGTFASMGYEMMGFNLIFGPIADSAANWYDASPKYHIDADTPPFVIFVSINDMEQIIGGDFGGLGFIFLPGEIQFTYNDLNVYQPTDSFWLPGDHDTGFSDFVYYSTSLGRIHTMAFIDDILAGIDDVVELPMEASISASPNPFNSAVRIRVRGFEDSRVRVEILDMNGRIVADIPVGAGSKPASAGGSWTLPYEITWQPDESIGSGVYLVRATIEDEYITKRIVYLK